MSTVTKEKQAAANDAGLQDDLNALKEDMATLRKDLQSTFGSLKGFAESKAGDGVSKGKEFAADAGEHIKSARVDLQSQIREKPMAAVGLAFGAGLLIALLGRK
ncbi:hypothetical protein [Hyphomonas sp.]|uniref:DUF883 family protein n=1 Tax=Hyphomonas sp. TaxID=87 RepID=UPI000C626E91|nr:hypothetical protein [Hyphomonas sp.]MAB12227.1 hypothetical protein [Hyphomonas sp.]MAU68022.1 hypothetical protein [Hyphomonas sp.]MBM56852.1 hypothetical protein [Hyphomonas sp.]